MGAAASAGRAGAGYGIGMVGGRGKAGAVELGPSVITDDDAFQSSQKDPHRKPKPRGAAAGSADDARASSRVRARPERAPRRHAPRRARACATDARAPPDPASSCR